MNTSVQPLVSVIIATYNRSNVLRLAILSLLQSIYNNWELIVVSDASTDDTAQVVASFNDPRIIFIQLLKNYGIQSGPNNEGLNIANGKYIAYLNHDDLWFPDHLSKLVECIELNKADWVIGQGFEIKNTNRITVTSSFPDQKYSPYFGYAPASLWLAKKEVIQSLGGWQMSNKINMAPSQDLLIRAFKVKTNIVFLPSLSVILFPSGWRIDCYKNRNSEEQELYLKRMADPLYLKEWLLEQSINYYLSEKVKNSYRINYLFFRFLVGISKNIGRFLGINPIILSSFLKYSKKGSFINKLRMIRGLDPIK